MNRRHYIDN